jgi:hypothetical protein
MIERPDSGPEVELSARLHDLVRTVGVQRMSAASVQRRVKQRARRRRLRRSLMSAAFASVILFLAIAAVGKTSTSVVTRGPLVPAAPQVSGDPAQPGDPTAATIVAPGEPTATTVAPVPSTTTPLTPGGDGREGGVRDAPTTRGGADNPNSRGG